MFTLFEHTADVGLRIEAPSLDELFAQAARGLFSLIVENLHDVHPKQATRFRLEGDDRALLLFDWLQELLYTFETRHLLLVEFEVTVHEHGLEATARGEPADAHRHGLEHEVKAITYHGLHVEPTLDGWMAEVIVDI